jgi:hypothetical protein
MRTAHIFMARLGALTLTLAMGCAPAYHCYSGCHVNCQYCPPPPLPYTSYSGCACHSCAASKYLSVLPTTVEPTDDGLERDQIPATPPDDLGQP